MTFIKKIQISLFLAGLSVTPWAIATPSCSPGSYASGSSCVLADPGYFVSGYNATEQNPALKGFFIPNSGSTLGFPAEPGYYVPTTAATAQTQVSHGYYTATTAAINQIPSGGIAAPITAALQSSSLLTDLAIDLIEADPQGLKAAVAYQINQINQMGVSAGRVQSNISALTLQGDLGQNSIGRFGVVGGYTHSKLVNSLEVNATGNTYQFGIFQTATVRSVNLLGMLVHGHSASDNERHVIAEYALEDPVSSHETLNSKPNVSWYGVQSKINYTFHHFNHPFSVFTEVGVLSVKASAFKEMGSATFNGAATGSVAGLDVASLSYTSIPVFLGVSYDILTRDPKQLNAPLTLILGVSKDLSGMKKLGATAQNAPTYSFDLPVEQTHETIGLIKLKIGGRELAKNLILSGAVQAQIGSNSFNSYQANLLLVKQF